MRISDWSSDVCSSDLGIQCSQVLAHRTRQRGLLGPLHISARHAALAVRVGLDDAGVGRDPFAANELFGQATLQDLFEHESQGVVVAEPAMPVLRKRLVVGYRILPAKAAEPDRTSVGEGKRVSVRVAFGGGRYI